MQIEVHFDPCQMTHADPRECFSSEGALYIALSAVVLVALIPRVLRPLLALIGDREAEEALCAPENKEHPILGVVGLLSLSALVWWYSPRSSEASVWSQLEPLGQALAGVLLFTAFFTGTTMLASLSLRTMTRVLSPGPASLVTSSAVLSFAAMFIVGDGVGWPLTLFPYFLVASALVRDAPRAAWKATRGAGIVSILIFGLQALWIVAGGLR